MHHDEFNRRNKVHNGEKINRINKVAFELIISFHMRENSERLEEKRLNLEREEMKPRCVLIIISPDNLIPILY